MSNQIYLRRFRSLVIVVIAVMAAAALAMGLTIWGLYEDAGEDASRDVGHIATILAEQTAQSVKAIDESLQGTQDELAARYEASRADFPTVLRSQELHNALAGRISRLPQAIIFAIVGPAGHTVNDSKDWPARDIDVSDRDYFAVHRDRIHPGFMSARW
jgi:hypothetical protein